MAATARAMNPARMMRDSGAPASSQLTASVKATPNQITRLTAPRIICARSLASAVVLTDRVEAIRDNRVGNTGGAVLQATRDGVAFARAKLAPLVANLHDQASTHDMANL